MWVRFVINSQPYRVGDVVDWTPVESARRLIAEGQVEETVSPEEAAKMEKAKAQASKKGGDEKGADKVGPNAGDVQEKTTVAPVIGAAVAPVRK